MAKKCKLDGCNNTVKPPRKKFCCDKHKDKYHNRTNPRGKFAHLRKPRDVEDDFHPFDSYSLGQE